MTSVPDPRPPLDTAALAALSGFEVEVVTETASTNALAADRVRAGAAPWTVVVTEHQTAGRGRLDRTWESPARAALTFSVVVRPALPLGRMTLLPLITGLAVAETIGDVAGVKWPNDVLIADRKVCGVLVELVDGAAIIGIGLNVSQTADELPIPTATSLALSGVARDRTELLIDLLGRLRTHVTALEEASPEQWQAYVARCVTIGRQVSVSLPDGSTLEGVAEAIDPQGRLVVGGRAVSAGDVVHARLS